MATTKTQARKTTKRKSKAPPASEELTLGKKVKLLRRVARLSQAAIGAQGFVSAPGWIKIEKASASLPRNCLKSLWPSWSRKR